MKYCGNCEEKFDTQQTRCPICGGELRETDNSDELTALMLLLGLL